MTLSSKFNEFTWPSSHFTKEVEEFFYLFDITDHLFTVYYRLLSKISNLGDIGLKFSGSDSDLNVVNPTRFRKGTIFKSRKCTTIISYFK